MSNYDVFRQRNLTRITIEDKVNNTFMFEGNSAIKVTVDGVDAELDAAVVNRQEKDSAYVFFPVATQNIAAGKVVYAKELYFLLTEEIKIIKNVDFKKYAALICNVELDGVWGYFKGPEESYINLALKEDSAVISQQKPVLVVKQGIVEVGNKLVIKGRPWLITEADITSNDYIGYYSLQATTISKKEGEDFIAGGIAAQVAGRPEEENNVFIPTNDNILPPQMPILMATEEGYFETDKRVNITKLNRKSVIFEVPYGINNITVTFKRNGLLVQQKYKVVL